MKPQAVNKKLNYFERLIIILTLIIFSIASYRVIITRTLKELLYYPLLSSAILSVAILIIIYLVSFKNTTFYFKKVGLLIFIVTSITIIMVYIIYFIGNAFQDFICHFLPQENELLEKRFYVQNIILIILFVGIIFFLFRLRFRSLYGLSEAITGLIIGWLKLSGQTSNALPSMDLYFVLLTASVYLVVRGIDNIHQGLTKEPLDPVGLKIFYLIKRNMEY